MNNTDHLMNKNESNLSLNNIFASDNLDSIARNSDNTSNKVCNFKEEERLFYLTIEDTALNRKEHYLCRRRWWVTSRKFKRIFDYQIYNQLN